MSMHVLDRGRGLPLVLLPGIQGRWEYMRPAIDALAESFRVITFALAGEKGGAPYEPSRGLDNYADQVVHALDTLGLERAVVAGQSFGGLGALRFAAREPGRTAALLLVSVPGPGYRVSPRHSFYARVPWLFGPLFLAETPFRLRNELVSALPALRDRRRFAWSQLNTIATVQLSVTRMAARSRLVGDPALVDDCGRVQSPTLIVTGEPHLDRVVPVTGTAEYQRLIAGARAATIAETGHLGYITRPAVFAETVRRFLREADVADAA